MLSGWKIVTSMKNLKAYIELSRMYKCSLKYKKLSKIVNLFKFLLVQCLISRTKNFIANVVHTWFKKDESTSIAIVVA